MGFAISSTAVLVMLGVGVQLWYSARLIFLGTGLFMAVGAFAATSLTLDHGVPLWIGIALAVLIALVIALPVGRLLLHLDGLYLALASLSLAEVLRIWAFNFDGVTGGAQGRIVPVKFGPWTIVLAAVACLAFSWFLQHAGRGRALAALRFDPRVAAAMGIRVQRLKWRMFLAGVAVTALAGALNAYFVRFMSPQEFGFHLIIMAFAVAMIGGAEEPAGPIFGALLLGLLPEYLRFTEEWSQVVLGLILILVLTFAPHGVVGLLRSLGQRIARPLRQRRRIPVAGVPPALGSSVVGRPRDVDPEQPALEIVDVSFSYGGLLATNDVSFSIRPGEVVGILGPNGAGKTTLLNLASGMITPSSGVIRVGGERVRTPADFARARVRRTFQHAQLVPELTLWENVLTAAQHAGVADDAESMARSVMDELGVAGEGDKHPGQVPLGVRRLVEMARALVAVPNVLLLDEPTSGADDDSIARMEQTIAQAASGGCAVVVVSHDVPSISRVAHRIVLMDLGAVVTTLPVEDLTTNAVVREVYVGEAAHA